MQKPSFDEFYEAARNTSDGSQMSVGEIYDFYNANFTESKSPAQNEQTFMGDSVDYFQKGILDVSADVAGGLSRVFGTDGATEDSLRDWGQEQLETVSDEGRKAHESFGLGEDDKLTGRGLLMNLASGAGSFVPTMALGAGAGAALRGAATLAKAGKTAHKAATGMGYAGTGAAMIGGGTAHEVEEILNYMPPEQLGQMPGFNDLHQSVYAQLGGNHDNAQLAYDEAKRIYIETQSNDAGLKGAIVGAISMGIGGPLMGKLIKQGAGGVVKSGTAGLVNEGLQEGFEEGSQGAIVNTHTGKPTWAGVGERTAEGALLGGILGGAVGGGRGAFNSTDNTPTPDDSPIDNLDAVSSELDNIINNASTSNLIGSEQTTGTFNDGQDQSMSPLNLESNQASTNNDLLAQMNKGMDQVENIQNNIDADLQQQPNKGSGLLSSQSQTGTTPSDDRLLLEGLQLDNNFHQDNQGNWTDKRLQEPVQLINKNKYSDSIKLRRDARKIGMTKNELQELRNLEKTAESESTTKPDAAIEADSTIQPIENASNQKEGLANEKASQSETTASHQSNIRPEEQKQAQEANEVNKYDNGGKSEKVITPMGTEVETQFEIIEASELIDSSQSQYDQAIQPRDRNRVGSTLQVNDIASNLDPLRLGSNRNAGDGAPIIGSHDNMVESGNGRTQAIKQAYAKGKADNYKQYLIDNSTSFGVDASSYTDPVLVRRRKTDLDRYNFAKESNTENRITMSPVEQAIEDADNIVNDDLLAVLNIGENGDFLNQKNREYVVGFLKSLSTEEQARNITKEGQPNKILVDRMKAAVFHKAYKSSELIEMVSESTDNESANVVNALLKVAPAFSKAVNKNPDHHPIVVKIGEGAEFLIRTRRKNTTVANEINQENLFGNSDPDAMGWAQYFETNIRSRVKIEKGLYATSQSIYNEEPNMTDMFGDRQPLTQATALERANNEVREPQQETDLFAQADQKG
ncbi:MAG: hypothetical protein GY829_06305, partial [Gammaproteobacteria bacterium]|nr:hypothetical protein [Gammaproteobacteria bacterium]